MKMADAKQKRNEQLKRWIGSETDLEPPVVKRQKTKVKFDDGAVFLAACSSGDTDEVLKLLHRGADINYANVDGLTALHQACIDDNVDMVKFLVENGANINQPDNEGWIPLHAAASCGYLDIAEFLIGQGAHVGAVNSEGDTPLDIAEEEAMEELLQNEVNRQGVDIEAARKEEERIMLRDARQWLNSGHINDVRHAKSGGTALHVAAAKGYTEVLKLLIQAGYDVNIKDYDGWTPLHAAAHWGKEEACRILVDNLCDMEMVNKVGQTAFDVADEDILGYLEELQKKQNLLHSEKRDKKSPLIESTANMDNNQSQKTFKNKETLIIEPEKNASRIESLEQEKVDEEEEGKKDESSCSSEEDEEDDSESEAETDKTKPLASVTNANTSTTQAAPVAVTTPTVSSGQATPTSPIKKYDFIAPIMPVVESVDPASWRQGLRKTGIVLVPNKGEKSMFPTTATKISPKEEERKDESPATWRLGLRKTGSYGALAEITASKEGQKEKDTAGVTRSASSPRLSSSLDNKEKEKDSKGTRLAYVAPTIPRRLASTSDIEEKENRDSSSLRTSSSYTRRKWEDDLKKNSSINEGSTYHKSCSFGRRQDDLISSSVPSTTSTPTVTSAAGLQKSLLSSTSTTTKITTGSSSAGTQSSTSNRLWAEDSTEKEKDSVPTAVTIPVAPTVVNAAASTTTLTTTTAGTVSSTTEVRERRRSYLTPVRDEESESQRKARSRQARQSRRSTQGVTLTDLQEAEKTIGRSRSTRTREQENEEKEKEEKEKQDKEKQEEKKESETSREDEYKQKYSRTYDETYQRYRPVSTSSSATPSSSLSTMSSSLYASSQLNRPNSLVGITSYSRGITKENEREGEKREEEKEGEDKSQSKSIRERRRPREKRRSTGVSFWTQDSDENEQEQQSDTEEGSNKKETQTDSISRYETSSTSAGDRYDSLLGRSGSYSYLEERKPYSSRLEKDDSTDFKKLYEQILAENEKLKAQLHDTNMELTDLKLQLEKATQRQERFADRSLLEMEKRERRALERRISEMEEELKMLPDLKADNQRLKDENGALIRVISKLSK
ncbi:protein phosphatase 1 regulatory subunit 12A isoform X1 [Macaca nemestrina]|uniref:protein phosphatase 1 regulatory subunit 12A isoform X1 n=1 Tax=Macaca nemestrina TaxID=9545 RepID=UPI0004F1DCF6|nr:protein phosphatase 1 regulatory subunit 12A isoform X1 [Macaca nemestrina]XP_015007781.1 protein phosphatase 1 regulatory subunit 12A isoform X1 [Macaca mulatta]XP_050605194.1 protein phosphatase 1 regulatory subunit 12A isoform X1 [Macaca thibetana thibetana]